MALSILQRPYQTIDGVPSKWNAIGNRLIYRMSTPSFSQSNYRLEIYVFDGSDTALNTEAFNFTPNTVGAILVDITTIVRAYMYATNDVSISNTNVEMYNDTNAYKKFYIKYKEVWTGSAEVLTSDSANQFYAVFGALQIPATYGPNLYNYTLFNVTDYIDGKFLTRFTRPTWWRGWPFLLSAIIDETLTGSLDIKVVADSTQYAGEQSGNAGRLVECNFGFVSQGVIDGSSTATVSIVDFATKAINYSEILTVELRDPCENPVMLMARNTLGGVLQWLFDGDQEYDHDYGNGIKSKRMLLTSYNLSANDFDALEDFVTLGEVYRDNITEYTSSTNKSHTRIGQQVYKIDQDGTKIGVIVITRNNRTQTKKRGHKFEIEIEFPEIFVP
jgi:hypothetical protein